MSNVHMILVLSSQHFSLLILVSVGNVSLSLVHWNKTSRLQNISPYVSLKGLLVRSYEISLVSYVSIRSHISFITMFVR